MSLIRSTVRPVVRYGRRHLLGHGAVNRLGRGVINLVDIGAVGGLIRPWHQNAPKVNHLLRFEPREPARAEPNVTTSGAGIWSSAGTFDLYILGGDGQGSSLLPPNPDWVRENFDKIRHQGPPELADTWFHRSAVRAVEPVECMTLDEALSDQSETYHFAKIDVQGGELEVLRGAHDFLDRPCLGLQLELYRVPLYLGVPLHDEVVAWLNDCGFELVKRFPAHGTFDSQYDGVFMLRDGSGDVFDAIRSVYGLAEQSAV